MQNLDIEVLYQELKIDGMEIKKNPTLGVVILYYIFALGMLILFLPSVLFYLDRAETQGVVSKIDSLRTHVKYVDYNGDEFLATTEEEFRRNGLTIGRKVKVYFKKDNPTKVKMPEFEGNEPYLVHFILIVMALGAVFTMHRDYLKGN